MNVPASVLQNAASEQNVVVGDRQLSALPDQLPVELVELVVRRFADDLSWKQHTILNWGSSWRRRLKSYRWTCWWRRDRRPSQPCQRSLPATSGSSHRPAPSSRCSRCHAAPTSTAATDRPESLLLRPIPGLQLGWTLPTATNWLLIMRITSPTRTLLHSSSFRCPSRTTYDFRPFTFLSEMCRCWNHTGARLAATNSLALLRRCVTHPISTQRAARVSLCRGSRTTSKGKSHPPAHHNKGLQPMNHRDQLVGDVTWMAL